MYLIIYATPLGYRKAHKSNKLCSTIKLMLSHAQLINLVEEVSRVRTRHVYR